MIEILDQPCPSCGHRVMDHAEAQHWPEGACRACRREMNPYLSGAPRTAEDVCKSTSREVLAALATAGTGGA